MAAAVLAVATAGAVTPARAFAAPAPRPPEDLLRIVEKADPHTRASGRVTATHGAVRGAGVELAIDGGGDAVAVGNGAVVDGNGVDYVMRGIDGGLQVAAVISEQSREVQRYRFAGMYLEQTDTGHVIVRHEGPAGEPIALIDPAWAVDARGAKVATRYRVAGDTLIQVSDLDHNSVLPVVADPRVRATWYGWSVDFSKSDTLALAAGAVGCDKVTSKSPPGVGRAVQLFCGFLTGWAALAIARGQCVSAKLFNPYVWAPWITKCYA